LPLVVASITEANDYKIDFAAIAIGGRTLEEHAADSATMSAVSSGDYDIVIIQEQSMMPASAFLESSTIPSARRIADAANQSGARVVFYQTWAHKNGNLQIYHSSYASMRDALVTGYVRMAAEAGGEIAPAGLAWDRALSNPDLAGVNLYVADGSHPTAEGTYVAAAAIAGTIMQAQIETAPSSGVSEAHARSLSDSANAVLGYRS